MITLTDKELAALPKDLREKLQAQQEQVKAIVKAGEGKITLKVGDKGGISLYGMGRFPVTLYSEQWDRLWAWYQNGGRKTFEDFQAANKGSLKTKADALLAKNGNGNG